MLFIYLQVMLQKIVFVTGVLFSLTMSERVSAQYLSWVYSTITQDTQGREKKGTVTYSVNSEITKIEDDNEIITISYAGKVLYRHDKRSDQCLEFPITTGPLPRLESNEKTLKGKETLLLSNFKLFSTDKHQKIASYACHLKRIAFGVDFIKFQIVASPTSYAFGQNFTESMVSYWVSQDVTGFDRILKIAKEHNALYESNPFLRQIDIVGLFEILHGFPVQIVKTVNNIKSTFTLIEGPRSEKKY